MPVLITKTKLIPPRRRGDMLTRPRLLDMLDGFIDSRLTLLTAPAGYGKTSLLVDFIHHTSLPVVWLSLDPLDNNPLRLLAHLSAAIQRAYPLFGDQTNSALDRAILDLNDIVPAIVNDILARVKADFLLVFDDFHLVQDNEIVARFTNRFVQEVDDHCHLVLASRTLIKLPDLPLLVARQQVAGLSFEELAFEPSEMQSLILQNYHQTISIEMATELVRKTEGWITGLVLSAEAMSQGMPRQAQAARVSGVGLYEYLIQQVLDHQTPEVQDFLMRTSFLEEFDPDLCREVFGPQQDWAGLMDEALLHNLFIQPIGDDGHWFRYHHLFRDFLQIRFRKLYPGQDRQILYQAARSYTNRGEWEKAYAIYIRLEDLSSLLDLIETAGSAFLGGGRLAILADWINHLPGDVLTSRPAIISLNGAVQVMQGKIGKGLDTLTQAADRLQIEFEADQSDLEVRSLLARTLARRSVANRFLGRYKQSIEDARRALELVAGLPDQDSIRAEAYKSIGLSEQSNGQVDSAIENLTAALLRFQFIQDHENIATAHMDLGLAYMSAAHYDQALEQYLHALDYWRGAHSLVNQATLFNNMGVLFQLMGDYQRSIIYFEDALDRAARSGYARMQAYIYCGIGDLYADLGAWHAARQAYLQAEGVADQIKYSYLRIYVGLASAELARRQGDFQLAQIHLANIDPLLQTNGSPADRAVWHLQRGLLELAEADSNKAVEDCKYAGWYFSGSGQRMEAAVAFLSLAAARYQNGEPDQAWIEFDKVVQFIQSMQNPQKLIIACLDLEPFLEVAGQIPVYEMPAARLRSERLAFYRKLPALRRQIRPHTHSIPFVPPGLSVQALGGSLVLVDGHPLEASLWQPRVRELFFRLLFEPGGLTREQIGLLLWPDAAGAVLASRFKNVMYKLRSVLPEDAILFEGERYYFNRNQDYQVDVEDFLAHIDLAANPDTPETHLVALKAAVAAYRGPFLVDLDSAWVLPEQVRLLNLFTDAGLQLAQWLLEVGDEDASRQTCLLILKQDPAQEQAHRLLMQIYAGQGNRAALVRQYEECRKALLTLSGASPSPKTRQLFQLLTQ